MGRPMCMVSLYENMKMAYYAICYQDKWLYNNIFSIIIFGLLRTFYVNIF